MTPRGIRNNNPLNIRVGNKWLGEVAQPTDKDFEQFVSMAYGIRAALIILRRYMARYHLNTIYDIVSRWAPKVENNVAKYAKFVSEKMDKGVLIPLDFSNREDVVELVCAMALYETGTDIDAQLVREVYYKILWDDKPESYDELEKVTY